MVIFKGVRIHPEFEDGLPPCSAVEVKNPKQRMSFLNSDKTNSG